MKLTLLLALLTVGEGDSSSKVKGHEGEDVTLPCHYDVNTHGLLNVCWSKGQLPVSGCWPLIVETEKTKVVEDTRMSNRYQLLGQVDRGDVSLTIVNVTETDAGRYGCRVDIPGIFNDAKHHIDLTVDTVLLMTTSTPVDTETSPRPTADAHTPGQMTTTTTNANANIVLTSSSSSDKSEETSALTVILLCVFFGLIVLVTVGGVIIIIARKWRRIKVPQTSVHFSSSLSTLQLQGRGVTEDNIYQIDEGEYDYCP